MTDSNRTKKTSVAEYASIDKPKNNNHRLKLLLVNKNYRQLIIVALIAALVVLGYGYVHTKNQLTDAKNPAIAGKNETQQITNRISKYIALPNDETPTLATIKDVSKLRGQSFFKNAQNGDKILIYQKAGTALLYRPSTQKVLEYAPISLNSSQ